MKKTKDEIINLKSTKNTNENLDFGEILPHIFNYFAKEMKLKFIIYFETLDDTLFDYAEKADSNQNQTLYFETMRNIRKKKDLMLKQYLKTIQFTFNSFKNNNFDYFEDVTDTGKTKHKSSLSLVDEKELDETLARINLINKSDMAYHRHIYAFKKRFSLLASGTKLAEKNIPIGPYVIVNAFAKCMISNNIDVNLKLIMFKLFERNVMGRLNGVYTFINELLAKQGIIPEITYNIGRSNNSTQGQIVSQANQANQASQTNQHNNTNTEQQNNRAGPNALSETQHIDPNYQIISKLFSQNEAHFRSTDGDQNSEVFNSQHPSNVPVASINMESMLNALSILQGEIQSGVNINESLMDSPTEIKNNLISQLHKLDSNSKNKQVIRKDEDTIDLVGMLFQFLVDDRDIPDAIQIMLARLQIPYLKIALKDRTMFADKNHPARVLLDNLSLASIGWTIETDKKNMFMSKVNNIIQKILDNDEYNPNLYIALSNNFEKFKLKLKKKSDIIQRRTNEKTLGKEKINKAKEQTAKLLVEKISNKQMPTLIRDILFGEWSNVLVLMYLRHSEDSEEHLEKIQFIDTVVDFSQQAPAVENFKTEINKILKIYKSGLELVAYNAKEINNKLIDLSNCLHKTHNIHVSKDADVTNIIDASEILNLSKMREQHEIVEYIQEIIAPTEDSSLEEINDEYTEIVKQLKIGNWLEFILENKKPRNAKLSWISPITGKYLFVNSRGLKLTDKSILALATGLRDNSIRILKQVALFDRALSSIAESLKQNNKP